jgi:hypothetical protein
MWGIIFWMKTVPIRAISLIRWSTVLVLYIHTYSQTDRMQLEKLKGKSKNYQKLRTWISEFRGLDEACSKLITTLISF